MRSKLLIFDWDGTLSDSVTRIVLSIQLAAKDHRLSVPTFDAAKDIIGLGLGEAINRLFPNVAPVLAAEFGATFSSHYRRHASGSTDFFPGVISTLQYFHEADYLMAVATGKSRAGLDRELAESGLEYLFNASRCADETRSKPDPLMIDQLLEQLQVKAEDAVMVGDTEFDMQMAVNAGVPRIAVSYGAHEASRLKLFNPIACIDQFENIITYV